MPTDRKDISAYLRKLSKLGYDVQRTGGDHMAIRYRGEFVTTHGLTSGGHRGLANLKATIRRFERTKRIVRPGGNTA